MNYELIRSRHPPLFVFAPNQKRNTDWIGPLLFWSARLLWGHMVPDGIPSPRRQASMMGAGPGGPVVPALGPPSPAIMGDGRAEWTTKAPISHAGWALLGHSNAGNAVGTAVCMGSSSIFFILQNIQHWTKGRNCFRGRFFNIWQLFERSVIPPMPYTWLGHYLIPVQVLYQGKLICQGQGSKQRHFLDLIIIWPIICCLLYFPKFILFFSDLFVAVMPFQQFHLLVQCVLAAPAGGGGRFTNGINAGILCRRYDTRTDTVDKCRTL